MENNNITKKDLDVEIASAKSVVKILKQASPEHNMFFGAAIKSAEADLLRLEKRKTKKQIEELRDI